MVRTEAQLLADSGREIVSEIFLPIVNAFETQLLNQLQLPSRREIGRPLAPLRGLLRRSSSSQVMHDTDGHIWDVIVVRRPAGPAIYEQKQFHTAVPLTPLSDEHPSALLVTFIRSSLPHLPQQVMKPEEELTLRVWGESAAQAENALFGPVEYVQLRLDGGRRGYSLEVKKQGSSSVHYNVDRNGKLK